jgi:hypothetical protein
MEEKTPENNSKLLYNKVKTNPTRVKVVLIDGTKVEGYLHQPPNLRLTDLLNRHTQDNPFLAVTDAKILFPGGELVRYKFFILNRTMILCCFPTEEKKVKQGKK